MTGVTVVIPTYNRSDLLARAIASVFAQQVTPDVVIIVDDGSTDDTSAVVAASDNGPVPLRYLHQDNAGGAAARNLGVEAATTEWVAFLDSDDEWESDHLAQLLQAVEDTDGAADLYFTDVHQAGSAGGGRLFARAGISDQQPYELRTDALAWAVAPVQPTMLQATLVRRRAYWRVGGLWPALSSRHDTHFFYFALAELTCCAVRGPSVVVSDDATGVRLTGGVGNIGLRYWQCTILLYEEVLRRRQDPDERRAARSLLADGHERCAAHAWRARDFRILAVHLARAALTDPLFLLWRRLPLRRPFPPVHHARARLSERGIGEAAGEPRPSRGRIQGRRRLLG